MAESHYVQILNLIHSYAELIDRGEFEAIGQLLVHADVYMPGESVPAVRAGTGDFTRLLEEWTRIYPETGTPRTRHITTNHIVEFDAPDAARARSSFLVVQQTPQLPLQPIAVGAYHDRFRRLDGVWHFIERREAMPLIGDLSAHLLKPFATGPHQTE